MPQPPSDTTAAVPRWLIIVGSVAITAHVLALIVSALDATSGPWVTMEGPALSPPPPFALSLNRQVSPMYLRWILFRSNYRFTSDRPETPGVEFEVHLKDEAGKPLTTVHFPDPNANFWVRQRQTLLAQGLARDDPVQPLAGEAVAAPHQQVRTVPIWDGGPDRQLYIREVPEHLIPRDRPVMRPSEWSMLLARSYVRYLCRAHGAASGEIARRLREPVHPALLFMPEPPPGALDAFTAHYGEFPR
jgi:hypothetical protein